MEEAQAEWSGDEGDSREHRVELRNAELSLTLAFAWEKWLGFRREGGTEHVEQDTGQAIESQWARAGDGEEQELKIDVSKRWTMAYRWYRMED